MSQSRYVQICCLLAVWMLAGLCLSGGEVRADDSTCIVCHTDESLLADNLGETQKKKSALQAGSG